VDGRDNPTTTTKKRFSMIQRTVGAVQKHLGLAARPLDQQPRQSCASDLT
jgi:hypothetical protein